MLRFRMAAHIYGEDVGTHSYKTPLTKWDMFKIATFPTWLLERYPAKYKNNVLSFKMLYPEYVPVDKLGRPVEFYQLSSLGDYYD
jgi:hypothetical protein